MQAEDIVVVNHTASYGFAYYSPRDPVSTSKAIGVQGFVMAVHNPHVILTGSGSKAVLATLVEAVRLQQQSGSGSRIFIVLTHMIPAEKTRCVLMPSTRFTCNHTW